MKKFINKIQKTKLNSAIADTTSNQRGVILFTKAMLVIGIVLAGIMNTAEVKAQPNPIDVHFVNVSPLDQTLYTTMFDDILIRPATPSINSMIPSCYNEDDCVNWGQWKEANYVVHHPNFRCAIGVFRIFIRTCLSDASKIQIHIPYKDLGILEKFTPSPYDDCYKLWQYLYEAEDAAENYAQYLYDVHALVSKYHFQKIAQANPQGVSCETYNTARISYYPMNCEAMCTGLFTVDKKARTVDKFARCVDGDVCCKVENLFCLDSGGALLHTEQKTVIGNNAPCEGEGQYGYSRQDCMDSFEETHPDWYQCCLDDVAVSRCKSLNYCNRTFLDLSEPGGK